MDELTQILKHEEDNKKKLFLAEKRAKKELLLKEKEIKENIFKQFSLKDSEKEEIMEQAEKEIEKIRKKEEYRLSVELENLKKVNKEKAIKYIVKKTMI